MAYDNPGWYDVSVDFTVSQAGGNSSAVLWKMKSGRTGALMDIQLVNTTTWAGTTPGTIEVGLSGDNDAYGKLVCVGAAGSVVIASDGASADDIVQKENIPGGTIIVATFTAPVGGSPAGAGTARAVIRVN